MKQPRPNSRYANERRRHGKSLVGDVTPQLTEDDWGGGDGKSNSQLSMIDLYSYSKNSEEIVS